MGVVDKPGKTQFAHAGEAAETREAWEAREAMRAAREANAARRAAAGPVSATPLRSQDHHGDERTPFTPLSSQLAEHHAPPPLPSTLSVRRRVGAVAVLSVVATAAAISVVFWALSRKPEESTTDVSVQIETNAGTPAPTKLEVAAESARDDEERDGIAGEDRPSVEPPAESPVDGETPEHHWADDPTIEPSESGWWCICYAKPDGAPATACRRSKAACLSFKTKSNRRGSSSARKGSALGRCEKTSREFPWLEFGYHSTWKSSSRRGATWADGACVL